jgi:broad specificity phosphatase PhoE
MRYLGSRDDALTEHGLWQAAQLAQALASLPLAAVYASPLQRATHTAAAIALAQGLTVTIEPRLVEAAMGTWEGLRRSEIIARGPDDAERHRQWEADPACAPPGGESLASVKTRVLACVRELAALHDGETVVFVSHVGPIKALLCAALGAPLAAAQRMFLDPATISVVDWGGNAADWRALAVLRLFNAHHHLGWTMARWMQVEAG